MKIKHQDSRQDQVSLRNLLRLPYYLTRGIGYHTAGHLHIPKPSYATLRVTGRCNSRCTMCSVWKNIDNRELSIGEIRGILRNPLFNSIEKFVLAGGEPTLREDLAEIAAVILESCPKLREMVVLTNGLEPTLVEQRVKEVQALPGFGNLPIFAVSVSLDGFGDTHEKIRRVPDAFKRVKATITRLQEISMQTPLYLCSTCVVQPSNVDGLFKLWEFSRDTGFPLIFSPVCTSDAFIEDSGSRNTLVLQHEHLEAIKLLLNDQLKSGLKPSNLPFWREYFNIVGGDKRRLPCHLTHYAANIDSDGTMFLCSADSSLVYGSVLETAPDELWYSRAARELRKRVKREFCPKCTISCDLAFCFSHEFFYYAKFLLREKIKRLLRQ